MITCPRCGTQNRDDAITCAQCRINLAYALEHADEFKVEPPPPPPPPKPMTKQEMAAEIGRLEGQISQLEATRREAERRLQSAKGNRTAGAAVVLIGLLGMLFLTGLWYLWGFLIIIGGLTLVTAIVKQSGVQSELKAAEATMAQSRSSLAELQARLMVE